MRTLISAFGPFLGAWGAGRGSGVCMDTDVLFHAGNARAAAGNAQAARLMPSRHRIGTKFAESQRPEGAVGECPRSAPA
ncbi:hypothetical protein HDA32_000873 [Spinactinospora alkalitolerans]|uniref:Uncharacterized protein n=1 Tax=Spinactinospora alkalitolerans TaxID=687207 RepID=A0A852TSN9_9ACTN|nr:hypothetical protein [Spinactinospora alkalitolerans]